MYPVPSVCAADQIADWFDGLSVCLNWNLRLTQQPLKGSGSVTSMDSFDDGICTPQLYNTSSRQNSVSSKSSKWNFQNQMSYWNAFQHRHPLVQTEWQIILFSCLYNYCSFHLLTFLSYNWGGVWRCHDISLWFKLWQDLASLTVWHYLKNKKDGIFPPTPSSQFPPSLSFLIPVY